MRIAILGTGDVGRHLAIGLSRHGHAVTVGTRDPSGTSAKEFAKRAPGIALATFADAARGAELAIVATKWDGTKNALELAGSANLAGKVVIDAVNPLTLTAAGPALELGFTTSAGEQIQSWLPDAKVVKAFNIVTATHMVDPKLTGGPPDMFFCGDDPAAKTAVADLLRSIGWNPIDIGGLTGARLLEPLAMLWITHGIRSGNWTHAFKLLHP